MFNLHVISCLNNYLCTAYQNFNNTSFAAKHALDEHLDDLALREVSVSCVDERPRPARVRQGRQLELRGRVVGWGDGAGHDTIASAGASDSAEQRQFWAPADRVPLVICRSRVGGPVNPIWAGHDLITIAVVAVRDSTEQGQFRAPANRVPTVNYRTRLKGPCNSIRACHDLIACYKAVETDSAE